MLVLDHVVSVSTDLDRDRDLYARLGFALQPRGQHTGLGTANHIATFRATYLEWLTVTEPLPANAYLARGAERAGAHWGLAFRTDDIDRACEVLTARGARLTPALSFGRPVVLDGRGETARFRVARLEGGAESGFLFLCQHFTPDLVWQPSWQAHANGAREIAEVSVLTNEWTALRPAFESLFGVEAVDVESGMLVARLGRTVLRATSAARLGELLDEPRTAGPSTPRLHVKLHVADTLATRSFLEERHVTFRVLHSGSIVPEPAETPGLRLEFAADDPESK